MNEEDDVMGDAQRPKGNDEEEDDDIDLEGPLDWKSFILGLVVILASVFGIYGYCSSSDGAREGPGDAASAEAATPGKAGDSRFAKATLAPQVATILQAARQALASGDVEGAVATLRKAKGLPQLPGRDRATKLLERCEKHVAEGNTMDVPPYKSFRLIELDSPISFQRLSPWRTAFPRHFGSSPFRPIGARDKRVKKLPLIERSGMCVSQRLRDGTSKSAGQFKLCLSEDGVIRFFKLRTHKDKSMEALRLGDYPRRFLQLHMGDSLSPDKIREYVNLSLDDGALMFVARNGFMFIGWGEIGYNLMAFSNTAIRGRSKGHGLNLNIRELLTNNRMRKLRLLVDNAIPPKAKFTLGHAPAFGREPAFGKGHICFRLGETMTIESLSFLHLLPCRVQTEDALALISGTEMYADFWGIFGIDAHSVDLWGIVSEATPAFPTTFRSAPTLGGRDFVIEGAGLFSGKGCAGEMGTLTIRVAE